MTFEEAPAPSAEDQAETAKTKNNERIKLIANAYDRASTACFSAGIFTPAVAFVQEAGRGGLLFHWSYAVIFVAFLAFGGILHNIAQRTLRGLQ